MPILSQSDIPDLLHNYGYWVVGAVVALESMGLPLPGEAMLITAAVIAGTMHELTLGWVIAAAASGAILGDNAGYWIGRHLGYWLLLRYGRHLGLSEERLKLGQYLFQRHGGAVVFFGRFVAVLRAIAAFLAGANHMDWRRFLLFNAAGACVWAGLYGIAAYYLGREMARVAPPIGIGLGVLAVIALAATAIFLRRHAAELQAEAETALPGRLPPATFARVRGPRRAGGG